MAKVNDKKVENILRVIEEVRRRKISDYSQSSNLVYVDPHNYLSKLKVSNNHIVQGRRGSGKTTLFLKSIRENKNDIEAIVDCQPIKNFPATNIILIILVQLFEKIEDFYNNSEKSKIDYNIRLINKLKAFFSKKERTKYEKSKEIHQVISFIVFFKNYLKDLKTLENKIRYRKQTKINNISNLKTLKSKGAKGRGQLQISSSFINPDLNSITKGLADVNGFFEIYSELAKEKTTESNYETEEEGIIEKMKLIIDIKESISNLLNIIYKLFNRKMVLYLDDYYLINENEQVQVIQFLHDIYKLSVDSCFSFKMSVLPYRIKLNPDGKYDLSLKDDFSPIKLDYDLSDFDNLKLHLINIVSKIDETINLSPGDIRSLFVNEEVLNYSIIASGGVPRDFMVLFADLINDAKINGRDTISKENVYNVVNKLKDDKDQNIEFDSDIEPKIIREKIGEITKKIVEEHKTNVFLYPSEKTTEEENLLRNLINLRYIHLIKENISSENIKKKTYDAYLVDMIFYATSRRMPRGFDFREFWKRDKKQRLPQLHRAPILKL